MSTYRERMLSGARKLTLAGTLNAADGAVIGLSGGDILRFSISEGAEGALLPGAVLSAQGSVTLAPASVAGHGDALTGAELTLALGAEDGDTLFEPLGSFIVSGAELCEEEAGVTLSFADALAYTEGKRFEDTLSYPVPAGEIWAEAARQAGIANTRALPCGSLTIPEAPEWGGCSVRETLGRAAAAAGCFVRIGRDGYLEGVRLWDESAPAYEMSGAHYSALRADTDSFGPADHLIVRFTGEEDTVCDTGTRLCGLTVTDEPLLRLPAAARNLLSGIAGLRTRTMRFTFRGDPTLKIGDKISPGELAGVLSAQTLRWDKGFSADCSCRAPDGDDRVSRALTENGFLNALKLVGTVDGGLLSAGSVVTNKLAAGAVTADKLDAASVNARTIEAVSAKLETLSADSVETDRLAAAFARFLDLRAVSISAQSGSVNHLVSDVLNVTDAAGGNVFIDNLAVRYAQMVSAALGALVLKGSDGHYYRVDVSGNGLTASEVTLTGEEIAAGETSDGRCAIVETELAVEDLSAASVKGVEAVINRITAAAVDTDALFARQAFIRSLQTSRIFGGKTLSVMLGEMDSFAGEFDATFASWYTFDEDKMTVGRSGSVYKNEIDDRSYRINREGRNIMRVMKNRMTVPEVRVAMPTDDASARIVMKVTADGGCAFVSELEG